MGKEKLKEINKTNKKMKLKFIILSLTIILAINFSIG